MSAWAWPALAAVACAHATPATEAGIATDGAVDRARWVMGTRLRVVVWHARGAEAAETAARHAFEAAERLDALLSHYRPESALSRLNARAGEWMDVPADFGRFLAIAIDVARRTDGLFDPTVGSIVPAADAEGRDARAPGATASDAPAPVGYGLVEIAGARVRLPAGMALDPGAIGKGYAVDAMVEVLRADRVAGAFVDFGGSSYYALGPRSFRVRLRDATGRERGPIVDLRDASLSTSMTRTFPEGRVHVVDPRTRRLVDTPRTAAVVLASATEADAVATALAVGGAGRIDVIDRFPGARAWLHEEGRAPVERGFAPARSRQEGRAPVEPGLAPAKSR